MQRVSDLPFWMPLHVIPLPKYVHIDTEQKHMFSDEIIQSLLF